MNKKIRKVWRYFILYGIKRTLIKVAGRTRNNKLNFLISASGKNNFISLIGCGQFGFSTICFFIEKRRGNHFLNAYDIDNDQQQSLVRFYKFHEKNNSLEDLFDNERLKVLYIASNHHSHTEYAIRAIEKGITVYIEKPIAVNFDQFGNLISAVKKFKGTIYSGYNRPFAGAMQDLQPFLKNLRSPLTFNCFISGHVIPADHWYRNPEEGTRICGNVGHWIDLYINISALRGFIPQEFNVQISYADRNQYDDNITIVLTNEYNDLVTICITARTEPFEGINETINLQCSSLIAKIDDFRRLEIWNNDEHIIKKYSPKDVGHALAIDQPFNTINRNWSEVEISTYITLQISEMVKVQSERTNISLTDYYHRYQNS